MTTISTTTGTGTGNGNQTTRHSYQWALVLIDAKYQTNRKLHHFRQDCFEHYTEEELVQIQEDCRDGGLDTTTDYNENDYDEGNDDSSITSMLSMRSISSSLRRRRKRQSTRRKHKLTAAATTAGTTIPAQIASVISSSSSVWDDEGDGHNYHLLDDSLSPSEDDEESAVHSHSDAWRYFQELEEEHSFSEETLDVLRSWVVQ